MDFRCLSRGRRQVRSDVRAEDVVVSVFFEEVDGGLFDGGFGDFRVRHFYRLRLFLSAF